METTETQAGGRRSGIRIMGQLIGLVKPLLPVDAPGHCARDSRPPVRHLSYDPGRIRTDAHPSGSGHGDAGAEPCGFGRRDVPSDGVADFIYRAGRNGGDAGYSALWRTVLQPFHCI